MMKHKKYKSLSDNALMEQFIRQRDPRVFAQVYERHFVNLSKYITWLSQDIALSKDITQTVLLKIFRNPQRFDTQKDFKVWLFVLARNQWKNQIRDIRTREKYLTEIEQSKAMEVHPPKTEQQEERLTQIRKAIKGLSDHHQEVVTLKYINNLTIKEISEILECSEGTIKSRLFYALENLRNRITIQHA